MDFAQIGQLTKRRLVSERNIKQAMMGEGAHMCDDGALLPTTKTGGADEDARVLPPEATGLPEPAGGIPERLPLGGEVAVTRGHAEQEGIVLGQVGRVGECGDVGVLGRSVHLTQDVFGEGFRDLVQITGASGRLDAFGFRLGHLLDVTPGGVLFGIVSIGCLFKGKERRVSDRRESLRRRWQSWVPY